MAKNISRLSILKRLMSTNINVQLVSEIKVEIVDFIKIFSGRGSEETSGGWKEHKRNTDGEARAEQLCA
jgi:hypothetical protein